MTLDRAIVLAMTGVLAFAIFDDLRNYRIRNSVVVMLFCLCVVDLLLRADLRQIVTHAVFAAIAFGLLILAFQRNWLGGGDTKLLAIAFLQTGPELVLSYAIILLVLTMIYWGGATLGVFPSQRIGARLKVPFGPSIAGAWMIILIFSLAL